jgi:ABC-type maltose transport system permease subunit
MNNFSLYFCIIFDTIAIILALIAIYKTRRKK